MSSIHYFDLGRLRRLLAEHGWVVLGSEPDDPRRAFAYTVGMTEAGLPELVTVGLPTPEAIQLLDAAVEVALRQEEGFTVGTVYPVVMPAGWETPLLIGEVHQDNYPIATVARNYYTRRDEPLRFRLQQVLWADDAGRYPTERATFTDPQIRLSVPRPGCTWID